MATIQTNRPMRVKTPLGDDVMLLAGFYGTESLSQLFHFQLDLLVEHTTPGAQPVPRQIAIDELLGQSITVEFDLPNGAKRYFNGICSRIRQGEMDANFTSYQMEIVPKLWLQTKVARSRIFQPPESTVPQILMKLFQGLEVQNDILGTFHPRDYCVQYRETDFNFASRIMEEEGIYYYFKHEDGKHTLVLANTPSKHADVPGPTEIIYENVISGMYPEDRIFDWSKAQELRSGKYTLWDYCFEKPDSHLDASAQIQQYVEVGEVVHKLKVGSNGTLEIYDFPGEYAQRFDGIDKGGGEKPSDIEKIFEDNARTVGIRMQEEAARGLLISGSSNCRHMSAGHKFSLATLNGDPMQMAAGQYVLTSISHAATDLSFRSSNAAFTYKNSFTCIPLALPFRPARSTPKPVVPGTQTAVVVGPAGEEIFTDKYGRIKVQFHWDREGKKDAGSSCWVRVATLWAGQQWGMIHIPRIGQEVVVAFLEGDPDQPIVVGSVFNAANMPPYSLPDHKTQSGIKSRSSLNGTDENFNEIRFEDKKGEEHLFIHAEKNQIIEVENDETHWVGHNQTLTVDNDRAKSVGRDETTNIERDRTETVGRDESIQIGRDRREEVDGNETIHIGKNRSENVDKDETITIGGNRTETVKKDEDIKIDGQQTSAIGKNMALSVSGNRTTTVKKSDSLNVEKDLAVTVRDEIIIKTGEAMIVMKKNGDILIKGKNIVLDGSGKISVKASDDVKVKGKSIGHN